MPLMPKANLRASSIFQIEEENNVQGFNIPGDLGALASLAGFSGDEMAQPEILLERLARKEFIIKMKEKYFLELDPFFNTYNPDYKDPCGKKVLRN